MSDRGILTIGIVFFAVAILTVIAFIAPTTRRFFWIAGLSIALLQFGGISIGIVIHEISRRSLNAQGLFALFANACVTWLLVEYLYKKIKEPSRS